MTSHGKTNLLADDFVPLTPGAKMPDGTIYAGVSPDTGKAMYTTPADASLTMKMLTPLTDVSLGLNLQ